MPQLPVCRQPGSNGALGYWNNFRIARHPTMIGDWTLANAGKYAVSDSSDYSHCNATIGSTGAARRAVTDKNRRTYMITVTAQDNAGNQSSASTTVVARPRSWELAAKGAGRPRGIWLNVKHFRYGRESLDHSRDRHNRCYSFATTTGVPLEGLPRRPRRLHSPGQAGA